MERDYKYMVATRCMTYNHAPFIEETLHGFTIQETSFPTIYIVVDDASTDGEQDVLRRWVDDNMILKEGSEIWVKKSYGSLAVAPLKSNPLSTFAILLLNENHYQSGNGYKRLEYIAEWNAISKYIAMCEGDDYWTDIYKLQKQVDYLEIHPQISFSCTRYNVLNQNNGGITLASNFFFDKKENRDKTTYVFSRDMAFRNEWISKTLTILYRGDVYDNSIEKRIPRFRDVHRVYFLLSKGNGVCQSFVGGVYRQNDNSTFGGKGILEKHRQNYLVYEGLYNYTGDKLMRATAASCYIELFKNHYKSYSCPRNALQLYSVFWYWPVMSIKKLIKKTLGMCQ